jgi:DNA-binding transcriptional MerR regulator
MKIGELAQHSGVAPSTIRFYESKGLLKSDRSSNGYRQYNSDSLRQIQLIRFSQSLGFSLDEMPSAATAEDGFDHDLILERLEGKRQEAAALLEQIQRKADRLNSLITLLNENWAEGQCLPAQTLTNLLDEANY